MFHIHKQIFFQSIAVAQFFVCRHILLFYLLVVYVQRLTHRYWIKRTKLLNEITCSGMNTPFQDITLRIIQASIDQAGILDGKPFSYPHYPFVKTGQFSLACLQLLGIKQIEIFVQNTHIAAQRLVESLETK